MNDLFSQIAIVAWGCKGGCRTFCDNRVVDVLALDIRTTLKDIRSFITISKPAMDFYALEFTAQYKVFTQYRSSNDSGNGAFIAFTIMVPHKVKIKGMRGLLNEMMNDYFKEYMNPLTFSPLSGKYDDINKYISILRLHESDIVIDNSHHLYSVSQQDDRPRLMIYDELSVVDGYFETPYRPEFFACQEVMFLSADLYNNQAKYEVRFLVPPIVIANVSEPVPESVIYPATGTPNYKITRFAVNGENFMGTADKVHLSNDARIDLVVDEEYYMPVSWTGVNASTLVEAGILKQRGRDYQFASQFTLTPKRYVIKVINDDEDFETRDLMGHLLLNDGNKRYALSKLDTGDYGFLFAGKWVERNYALEYVIQEFKDASVRNMIGLVKLEDIHPLELIQAVNPTIILHVHEVELRLKAIDREPDEVNLIIHSPSLQAPVELKYQRFKERLKVALPSKGLENPSFTVEAENFDIALQDNVYVFTPTHKVVTLRLQRQLRDALGDNHLKVQYKAKDDVVYDGILKGGKYEFVLPYKWREDPGCLLIQGRTFGMDIDGDEVTFRSSIIVNKSSKNIVLKLAQKEGETETFCEENLASHGFVLFPADMSFQLPEFPLAFKTREYGYDNGVYRVDIEDRESRVVEQPVIPAVTKDKDPETPKADEKIEKEKTPVEYWVTLCDCDDLFVHLRSKKDGREHILQVAELSNTRLQVMSDYFKIYNKKDKEICAVYFPRDTYYNQEMEQEADNRKNGFEVEWTSDTECKISYSPLGLLSRLKGVIDKKMLMGLLALLLVCVAGAFGYYFFRSSASSTTQLVISFGTNDESKIERIESNLPGMVKNEGAKLIIERKEALPQDSLKGFEDKTVSVCFEGSDKDTYTVQEIPWPTGTPDEVKSFLEGKRGADTIEIMIPSPGEKMLQALWNKYDAGACTIKDCADAAQKYKSQLIGFNEIACLLARANDFERIEEFKQDGTVFNGTEMTNSLLAESQIKQGAKEADAAKAAEEAGLKKQYDGLLAALDNLSCTSKTVDQFETFCKNNSKYYTETNKKRIAQYRLVFGYPGNGAISSQLEKKYFSKKQWTLLNQFVKTGRWNNKAIVFNELDTEYKRIGGTY